MQTVADHNKMQLEISNKRIRANPPKMLKLNNTLLNNQWVKEETIVEIRKYFDLNDIDNTPYENWKIQ